MYGCVDVHVHPCAINFTQTRTQTHSTLYTYMYTETPPRSISNTYRQTQFLLVDSTRSESGTVANYSDSKSTQCKHDVHTWRCGCRSEHGTWEAWPPIPMHASTTHNAKHAHNIIEHINHLDRYRRTRIYIYTCTYLHTYIYTYIPMQCMCTYAYIHTYIHTYMYQCNVCALMRTSISLGEFTV